MFWEFQSSKHILFLSLLLVVHYHARSELDKVKLKKFGFYITKIMYNPREQLLIKRIQELSAPMEPQPTQIAEQLPKLQGIRALLFDLYGTLFISGTGDISLAREMSNSRALAEALECADFTGKLKKAGERGTQLLLEAIQQTHAARRVEGKTAPEVDIREEWHTVLVTLQVEDLLEGEITDETISQVSVEYECRVNPVWPMPDLRETLDLLRDMPLLLGIVSNAQFYTLLLFPALLGRSHADLGFDADLCAWSFQYQEAKPATALFLGVVEQLRQYGIAPEEALYVGNDMLNDIWPATQLGLKTALFAGDQRSLRLREDDPRCSGLEPNVILTQLSQLSQVICQHVIDRFP